MVRASLEAAGFNTCGVLSIEAWDDRVPAAWRSDRMLDGACSVRVLGCGGRGFGDAFLASPEARRDRDPIDSFTRRVVEEAVRELEAGGIRARAGFYWERREGEFADFVGLGHACGLGVPSRLGVLIHPTYGPWISLRAVILSSEEFETRPPLDGFAPCSGCPAPCETACPGAAVAEAGFDVAACVSTTRSHSPCRSRCAARHACVVGSEHAAAPDLEQRYRAAVIDFTTDRD